MNVYNIFAFEPLYDLHICISKLLKECKYKFHGSDTAVTNHGGLEWRWKPVSRMRASILFGVSSPLAATERQAGISGLYLNCSSKSCSMQCNGFFLNSGVRGMLEGKDCRAVDIIFLFIGASTDRAAAFQSSVEMAGVHRMYSDIVSKMVSQNYSSG